MLFSKNNNDDELLEQIKILNTLLFLDSQYNHADSILSTKEIQDEYIKIGKKLLKE